MATTEATNLVSDVFSQCISVNSVNVHRQFGRVRPAPHGRSPPWPHGQSWPARMFYVLVLCCSVIMQRMSHVMSVQFVPWGTPDMYVVFGRNLCKSCWQRGGGRVLRPKGLHLHIVVWILGIHARVTTALMRKLMLKLKACKDQGRVSLVKQVTLWS